MNLYNVVRLTDAPNRPFSSERRLRAHGPRVGGMSFAYPNENPGSQPLAVDQTVADRLPLPYVAIPATEGSVKATAHQKNAILSNYAR